MDSSRSNIAVIGGGVSGIRAALSLVRAGFQVTFFEKNRHLGGRVFSFPTADFGEVDIGQHIWLRSCYALEALLHDLGVPDDWVYRQDRVHMPYRRLDGTTVDFTAGRWPGSLGFLWMLARLPDLRLGEKLAYLRAGFQAKRLTSQQVEQLDQISFADWLRQQRQSPAVIEWFWQPFVVGVCNGRLEEVSARHAVLMVRETLLRSPEACAICLLRRPLSAVFDRLARQVLTSAGAVVRVGTPVESITPGRRVQVCLRGAEPEQFDRVILALPLKYMRSLLPTVNLPPPPEEGAIVGQLLRFTRPVMEEMFFTAIGSAVQHVFNKSAVWGESPDDGSQVVELVLSAAEREMKLGVDRLTDELLPALRRHLPAARDVPILARRMLPHGTATFRVAPGGEARRLPTTRADCPNVLFAGDYAATGLPSTIESAVRAGQSAADLVLADASLARTPGQ